MKFLLAAILLATSFAAHAVPLTVQPGESWLFTIKDGEPANARKVKETAKPGKGQLMVSIRALFGTYMIMTNNSPVAYTFRAELYRGGEPAGARTCTLPANAQPIVEQWSQAADAVRLSTFRAAKNDGRC